MKTKTRRPKLVTVNVVFDHGRKRAQGFLPGVPLGGGRWGVKMSDVQEMCRKQTGFTIPPHHTFTVGGK